MSDQPKTNDADGRHARTDAPPQMEMSCPVMASARSDIR
jgi:hypothetical protein